MSGRRQLALADEAPVSRQTPPPSAPTVAAIALGRIDPSPFNPRTVFDALEIGALAESLKADGQIQPIVVRPIDRNGETRFSIVAGERRWRAARELGWTHLEAVIRQDLDDAAHARLSLLENLARTDLDPLDEARGYQQLIELGMTQEQVADAVHRSRPAIANALRLLKAPEAVQQKLRDREISPSHVLALLRYEAFPAALVKIAEVATEQHTPTKKLEQGLPWECTNPLKEARLAVELSTYKAAFDITKVCKNKCPFGAYVAGEYTSLCLKPEHYQQLQKEARAAEKAKLQKALTKGASADGTPALELHSLKYGQYERLDWASAKPKGCTEACECRAKALDSQNHPVPICTKPSRFRDLQQQAEAARKARAEQLGEASGQVLVAVDSVGSRELALLAVDALGSVRDKELDRILGKHAPGLKPRGKRGLDDLAALEPVQLVKIAVEALLSHDIASLSEWNEKAAYATWYAGAAPKVTKPTKRGKKAAAAEPAFDPDAQLADEIAAEQQRLAQEAALFEFVTAPVNREAGMQAIGHELHELLEETPV